MAISATVVEFTREQLLDELGWRSRAEFKYKHEFPDPEIPYRSITDTAREVTAAIERFTSRWREATSGSRVMPMRRGACAKYIVR